MKKSLVIIFSIILCIALAGAAVALGGECGIIKKDEPISSGESEKENLSQKTDKNTESIVIEETETLSAEDKALKAEIAKISDTKVDFRVNKQDKIGGKTYNMTYKELGDAAILYTSTLDNGKEAKFTYNLKSGKLRQVVALTDGYTKTENSITLEQARKIAVNIAEQYCDISVYPLVEEKENMQFYQFIFSKKIGGYIAAEGIVVDLDFNGDIYILQVCLDVFENEDFIIDENKLLVALEDKLNKEFPDRENYTVDKQRISVSEGKPVMEYYVTINVGYPIPRIYTIPIE